MNKYAHIVDGAVDAWGLPEVGVLSDGRTVSNYNLLPTDELKAEGWLLCISTAPNGYDPSKQYLTVDTYTIGADGISVTYKAVNFSSVI